MAAGDAEPASPALMFGPVELVLVDRLVRSPDGAAVTPVGPAIATSPQLELGAGRVGDNAENAVGRVVRAPGTSAADPESSNTE